MGGLADYESDDIRVLMVDMAGRYVRDSLSTQDSGHASPV